MNHNLSRRRILQLGMAAGATAIAGSWLTGCTDPSETANAAGDTSPWGKAKIDWKQFDGTTLVFGASTHQWITALQPHLPTFEKLTGIKVQLDASGEEQFNTKLPIDLNSSNPTPDVFMVPSYGQAVGAGWLEPLDDMLGNSKLTDESWYQADDVFRTAWDFVTWNDAVHYGLPITAEVQTTIFRTDLMDSAPATFDDLETVAGDLKKSGQVGIGMRGKPTAGSVAWSAAGYVFSYGGYIIDPDGNAALDSPQTIAAVQKYADVLKVGGPEGISSWDWLEINSAMQQGRTAMMQDSSNAIPDLRNPDKSKFADSIGVAPFTSHDGLSIPNVWHWVIGINANSANKEAAWLFLQWATSVPTSTLLSSAGATPPRSSAWKSPEFAQGFGEDAAKTVVSALETVDSKPMVAAWMHPKWPEIGDAFARAVNKAITSSASAEDALAAAQRVVTRAIA